MELYSKALHRIALHHIALVCLPWLGTAQYSMALHGEALCATAFQSKARYRIAASQSGHDASDTA
eukprot:2358022-Pyramimonas_sp.AAC.1